MQSHCHRHQLPRVITYAYLRIEDEPKKNVRLHCLVITYAYLRIEEKFFLPSATSLKVIIYAYLRIEDDKRS